jgi:hypothetical protein
MSFRQFSPAESCRKDYNKLTEEYNEQLDEIHQLRDETSKLSDAAHKTEIEHIKLEIVHNKEITQLTDEIYKLKSAKISDGPEDKHCKATINDLREKNKNILAQLRSSSNINEKLKAEIKKLSVQRTSPVVKPTQLSANVDLNQLTGVDLSLRECDNRQVDLEYEIEDLKEKLGGADRLETLSYEVRSSDNPELIQLTGKPIKDIYYTGDDANGQEHDWSSKDDTTTKQHQLDELYSAVYQSALNNSGKQATTQNIDSLYDGFNSPDKTVRMIRCLKSTANVSISDPVKFKPSSGPASGANLQSKWIVQIKSRWIDATSGYYASWQINLNKFVRKSIKPFMEHAAEEKLIVPVSVPGHSVAVYFEYNTDDGIACYWVDPNGPVNPEGDFSVATSCVKALWKLACYHNDIIWKDHLLCNIQPQGGPTLNFIKTGGLCAAFTSMIMLLVALNPEHTLEQIHQYLKFRVEQWSIVGESLSDKQDATKLKTLVQLVKQELGYDASKEYDIFLNNPDGTNAEDHSIVIQGIQRALDSGKQAATKIARFRQLMVSVYGDASPLNWMECHILMFMQFIDEWYDETQPFAFFKSDDKALARGLETFTKDDTGKLTFHEQNGLGGSIKTKKDLKIFLESGDERKKYIQKCGKESYNKEAK